MKLQYYQPHHTYNIPTFHCRFQRITWRFSKPPAGPSPLPLTKTSLDEAEDGDDELSTPGSRGGPLEPQELTTQVSIISAEGQFVVSLVQVRRSWGSLTQVSVLSDGYCRGASYAVITVHVDLWRLLQILGSRVAATDQEP